MERELTENPQAREWAQSWVAYVGPSLKYGLLLLLVGLIDWLPWWLGALAAARLVYRFAEIRSLKVFVDGEGVWVRSGILPWTKGVYGVKWRDVDQAQYFLGMIPWLTGSHYVLVGHRFTKASEVKLPHIARAKELVHTINGEHAQLARDGALA